MAELLARRNANIENNRKMLLELGIGPGHQALTVPRKKPVASKKAPPKPQPKPRPVKRSADEIENDAVEGDAVSNRMIRVDEAGTRRSARNVGKPKLDYSKEISEPQVVTIAQKTRRRVRAKGGDDDDDDYDDGYDEEYEDSNGNTGNRLGKRLHNPKTYGDIPGVPIGTWWRFRSECSTAAIHAPFVAGISGDGKKGAYSLALSGGYEDDVDLGYAFTYTGAGGRDLKGTKENRKNLRTAPQSSDQTFENPLNRALQASVKTGNPVRVIRGFKLHSEFAPSTGYRYDGLYKVEKAYLEKGLNPQGYLVCKYALKRIDGQPPLTIEADEDEEERGSEEDGAEENADEGSEQGASG